MIFDPEYIDTFRYQALKMMEGASEQISEFFPAEGEAGLVLSGIVFRPATEDDLDEDDEDRPDLNGLYALEVHFYAEDHPMIGSTSTRLLFDFPDCETYEAAALRLYREIYKSRCGAYPPDPEDPDLLLSFS